MYVLPVAKLMGEVAVAAPFWQARHGSFGAGGGQFAVCIRQETHHPTPEIQLYTALKRLFPFDPKP